MPRKFYVELSGHFFEWMLIVAVLKVDVFTDSSACLYLLC